ncbi:three-helix bundle dimerization domain-containing protein [Streptomyces sp. S.PB5]|uniref:three-helix bundle dimerization domain-containing protein n=1 Tax=Streptomyces sp. S.PB5 TaxID=3020844 RepID=UPI0025AFA109|nr:hypothetical protein [Streptomyces sp. S.PB5]MDN3027132.1 hypothetical protein [Streptomyces sp. S.PB5]
MISRANNTDWVGRPGSHCPDTAREGVRTRLIRPFPGIPSETLAKAEAFTCFADAHVRHYVPVLAFKRAAEQLSLCLPTRGEAEGEP